MPTGDMVAGDEVNRTESGCIQQEKLARDQGLLTGKQKALRPADDVARDTLPKQ